MYIACDLFITLPILRSTLCKIGTTHCCSMYFQYTLLADIFNSSSQLILKELTFFCNLFPFLKEVLGSSLHRCCQHMSLLGASLLLIRWAFVAGVYQSGDLYHGYKIVQQQRYFIWTLDEFGRLQLCQKLFSHMKSLILSISHVKPMALSSISRISIHFLSYHVECTDKNSV